MIKVAPSKSGNEQMYQLTFFLTANYRNFLVYYTKLLFTKINIFKNYRNKLVF